MIPLSIGWVWLVVFGGKNISSTFVSSTAGCAGQLSITITIFLPSRRIFLSRLFSHDSKSSEVIQALLLATYSTGTFTFLKALGL